MNAIHRLVSSALLLSALALAAGCPGSEEEPPVADGGNDTGPGATGSTGTVDDSGSDGTEPCVEEPTDPVGLLNQCTDATCEPFANTPERLPRLAADGSLPPLP